MQQTAGFVLVGGHSRRMGQDKALLALQGVALAARLAERARDAAGSATLVGSREKYAHLGWPVVEDLAQDCGPLGGVYTALKQTAARWNLVIGCDLPFLTAEFMAFLLRTAQAEEEVQVVVPRSLQDGYEPLAAVYRRDCLSAAETALERQEYKIARLLERLRRREVPPAEWRPFDPGGVLFQNVNTPEEWARARRAAPG